MGSGHYSPKSARFIGILMACNANGFDTMQKRTRHTTSGTVFSPGPRRAPQFHMESNSCQTSSGTQYHAYVKCWRSG